jgi:pyruvate dehydrogenase E2 component (dihydrolipoamide acetyltransferase)
LIVPVIRDAESKDLIQLAGEIADLAQRARERRLRLEELKGGSFTISSIGPLGGAFATPIIQYPQVAIMGLHAMKDRPAVVDGQVVPRKTMFVSLSYDHRVVDGAVAARFMAQVIELIEHPELLMLRL